MGSGADNFVLSLATTGSEIFTGGRFTSMGGKEADYFSRWTAMYNPLIPLIQR